jgi:hypothetical protein
VGAGKYELFDFVASGVTGHSDPVLLPMPPKVHGEAKIRWPIRFAIGFGLGRSFFPF